jgi:hypothetical protein
MTSTMKGMLVMLRMPKTTKPTPSQKLGPSQLAVLYSWKRVEGDSGDVHNPNYYDTHCNHSEGNSKSSHDANPPHKKAANNARSASADHNAVCCLILKA